MGKHKCEFEDCQSLETGEYVNQWIRDDKDEHGNVLDGIEWLCDEHAKREGFCLGCHYFCAGRESYDFSEIEGFCYDCVQEMKYEFGEYDDDYDDYADDFDYDGERWND
jgi:hypothetical protein